MDALVQQSYRDKFTHIKLQYDFLLENHRVFISKDNYYVCVTRTLSSEHMIKLWKKEIRYEINSDLVFYSPILVEQSLHTTWDTNRFPHLVDCLKQMNKDYRINLIQTNPGELHAWIRDWIYEEKS